MPRATDAVRARIQRLLDIGIAQSAIAAKMARSDSTISRFMKHETDRMDVVAVDGLASFEREIASTMTAAVAAPELSDTAKKGSSASESQEKRLDTTIPPVIDSARQLQPQTTTGAALHGTDPRALFSRAVRDAKPPEDLDALAKMLVTCAAALVRASTALATGKIAGAGDPLSGGAHRPRRNGSDPPA